MAELRRILFVIFILPSAFIARQEQFINSCRSIAVRLCTSKKKYHFLSPSWEFRIDSSESRTIRKVHRKSSTVLFLHDIEICSNHIITSFTVLSDLFYVLFKFFCSFV